MSASLDAATGGHTGASGASSLTISHTASASASLATVDVSINATSTTVSGITYAGSAMTQLAAKDNTTVGGRRAETWYIASPTTGTNDVVISFSAGCKAAAGVRTWLTAASPPTGAQTKEGTGGAGSDAMTAVTSSATSIVADILASEDAGSTPDASQTVDYNELDFDGASKAKGTRKTGAASVTMSYASFTGNYAWIGYSIDASGGGGGGGATTEQFVVATRQLSDSGGVIGLVYV